ncbi:MAG: PIG-L family deacetylase, partial [Ignavibacteriae bacterium]|nr:PIG-L family deacetylase [Ignavibacteriota bacterium]
MKLKPILKLSFYIFFLITSILNSQPQKIMNSAEIMNALEKLNTLGSVLYIAAHPDDENTGALAYFSQGKKYRTGYLALTRGDGGQNLIGSETGEQIGIIRTQELLEARKIDGAEQFFTRAIDFGYSKSPEETFEFWGKDNILSDVVWVIRNFRPDVIITRFPPDGSGGHGHHTASAMLAKEAFYAAADPNKFKEQLQFVKPWQTKRLFWNKWRPTEEEARGLISINVGEYNPLLAKSYSEIAAESRSMHKSQGFGATGRRGTIPEYFEFYLGDKPESDLFENIDLSWNRVDGSSQIQKNI